ncbi:MAG: hypothetical protein RR826_05735 [Christensenellaceae bacterium]
MKRFNIFAGNYGSGKTEISLNTALELRKDRRVTLVDMDTVNPYFRSAESAEMLKQHDIALIAPTFANTNVDVPAISAAVFGAFESENAIFDAGGDPVGAVALGGLFGYFMAVREQVMFYYVINARRPMQQNAEEITEMLKQISARVRLKVDGLINNTNLGAQSSVQDLIDGAKICAKVSDMTGIPLLYTAGKPEILKEYKQTGFDGEMIPLTIYTWPEWL